MGDQAMRPLTGKVAFVTGGASGIGFAMAEALGGAGMKVMLADIEPAPLDAAARALSARGLTVASVVCDVSERASVQRACDATLQSFGKVHVVCNNAGIATNGSLEATSEADWQWILGVNLLGVVHGVQAFLPILRAQGEGGHIVNTASMAGMRGVPMLGAYCATKAAVVSLSETLAGELAGSDIGVTVLCPAFVKTRIDESARVRPSSLPGEPAALMPIFSDLVRSGIDPAYVARRTIEAIEREELYVFTHPDSRAAVTERVDNLMAAFNRADRDPPAGSPVKVTSG